MAKRFEVGPPRALADGLWCVDADGYQPGLHVPLRMTVARLADGGLWLYSPVPIDDALAAALAQIGPVRAIVAPSRFHYLFAVDATRRYRAADLWVSPGLAAKRPELPATGVQNEGEPQWPELAVTHMRGIPKIDEFVFLHRPSRSMICADAFFNIRDEPNWTARQLFKALGVWRRPAQSRAWRWATRDREAARAAAHRVLAWEPERVVMAHGDVLEDGATGALTQAFKHLTG